METIYFKSLNKGRLKTLVSLALGDVSKTRFARQTGIDKDYLELVLREGNYKTPDDVILQRIASQASNGVTYADLKAVVTGEKDSKLGGTPFMYCISLSGDYDVDAIVLSTEDELSLNDIIMVDDKEFLVSSFFSLNERGEVDVLVSEIEKRVKATKLGVVAYIEREDDIESVFTPSPEK